MQPVLASKFISKITDNQERSLLLQAGIVPVNDVIFDLWEYIYQVWLIFGGRGGGKSEGVFDRLVRNCIEDDYFNCYYGRKVWDTIHKSCFETLISCIRKQNKEHLFSFSEADNSSMIVRYKANGNRFVPFGADKPTKLKSIKDPTHIVCEEFDQFTFKDFQELYPTLRTIRAKCEFFGMFNTKDVFPDHWLLMIFFPEMYSGPEKITFDALSGVDIKKIFVNYTDNHFIDQEKYYQQLRLASGGNQMLLESIANGAWGVVENNNPWLHAFREENIRILPLMERYPIYLTFDINADPLSCTAWQMSERKGGVGSFLHAINEFGGKIKVEDICQQIKATYPASIFYVTGDRSGQNQDVGRNQTIYQIVQSLLNLSDRQMNLNTSNLEHSDSRLLCNSVFTHYPVFIDPNCKNLITDCRKATCDPDSIKPSQLLKDRGNYKMDYFDGMRYLFQTYFNKYIKENYLSVLYKKK